MFLDSSYWEKRYQLGQSGWDTGEATGPLKTFIDTISDKRSQVLVPGGGNGHEVAYMHEVGFTNVYLLDWAKSPIEGFLARHSSFPRDHALHEDFFALDMKFDFIIEQTFFCALDPKERPNYVQKMGELLKPKGILAGVLFNKLLANEGPPFGGTKEEYEQLFAEKFEIRVMEECSNSIGPRQGNELFFELIKK